MKGLRLFTLLAILFLGTNLSAQKIEKATVVEFESPYSSIKINVNDEDSEFTLDEATKFKDKKGKDLLPEKIVAGLQINLEMEIKDEERVIKEIKVVTDIDEKNIVINGLFEFYQEGIAYIDGRKIKLEQGGSIKGSKKEACKCKGMLYTGFKDKMLPLGSYMIAKGELKPDGIVYTKEIEVCKNVYTPLDKELRLAVDGKLGLEKMTITAGGLANGNILIGGAGYQLHDNIDIQGYVNKVGRSIIPQHLEKSEEQNVKFRFFVIENDVPNAFAYPNGMVFIHSGLLNLLENEAQLAYVLGHEIAHVSYEHGTHKLQEAKKLEKWQGAINQVSKLPVFRKYMGLYLSKGENITGVSSEFMVQSLQILTTIRPEYLSSLHNKDKERQADRIGLLYMSQAGYDVREAPKVWKKMMEINESTNFKTKLMQDAQSMFLTKVNFANGLNWKTLAQPLQELVIGKFMENIYITHPETKSRYEAANTLIATFYKDNNFEKTQVNSEAYKKAIVTNSADK